jgi:cation diffusion facilitator CzcD-associated flavoprotein CzcO
MHPDYQVGIIGAGFGGIIAALELQRAGRSSFVLFERAAEIGGVWRDNVYPGCGCDVRSNLYSIAGEPNPNWSSSYATQPEILQYLKDIVERRGLGPHIRYGVNVTEVKFLESQGCWRISGQNGTTWLVRTIIAATGPQSRPLRPDFEGLEKFQGRVLHSAAWDKSLHLTGKRIAVIGTGASAVQIVPNLAPLASQLTVFQRSASWILPRGDHGVGMLRRWLYRNIPWTQILARALVYWSMELIGFAFLGNSLISEILTRVALRKLRREVKNAEVRKKLTPNYKIGCKRVLLSDDFYPAFNQPNVHLVTEPIEEVTECGIRTRDGRHHEVDVIVLATGFVVADTDGFLRFVGKGGRVLTEEWNRNGSEAFLGINVSGFPNLALLLGPNSGLGHSSALHVMESQMQYILQYLAALDRAGMHTCLDVASDVQCVYSADLRQRLKTTVWSSGCRSWYLSRDGRNTTIYPGLTKDYRRVTARFDLSNYVVSSRED